ncbi:unnamed protein product, partial [Mesorhabditis belari]|uniref:Uncharacterized protein n=1 Tax=Mesorhabditis belari TaxID=2138241 RepID=A0AAF3FDE0_9BILA
MEKYTLVEIDKYRLKSLLSDLLEQLLTTASTSDDERIHIEITLIDAFRHENKHPTGPKIHRFVEKLKELISELRF